MARERFTVARRACAGRAATVMAMVSIGVGIGGPPACAEPGERSRPLPANRAAAKLLEVPLSFEPNEGQADRAVEFLSRGSGYAVFLTPGKVVLNLEVLNLEVLNLERQGRAASVDTVRMSLVGANPNAQAVGGAPQAGVVSYLIGNDPKKWRAGIPTYGNVRFPRIYPGVDLVFHGNQRQLEYDFEVAPGADPSRIAWSIDGARARIDARGSLILQASHGAATFQRPVVYQLDGDKRVGVESAFAVEGNRVRFRLGGYDHSRALIIDPVLSYASYLAGSGADTIANATGPGNLQVGVSQGLALDSAGSVYVTGTTQSTDFPAKSPYQSAPPQKVAGVSPGQWPTAFVTKFSPDGGSLVYSTYLGGNGSDRAYAIAVDSGGSAYVTGLTSSPNFPTTPGAYQTVCSPIPNNKGVSSASSACGSSDYSVFVTKLNATGTGLAYSTFLGGYSPWSYAVAIAVDSAGRAYIAGNESEYCTAGYTYQGCFPTTSGAVIGGDKTGGGSPQYAFVAAFDPTGAQLLYSTLFGDLNGLSTPVSSIGDAWATGVAVDANGYFYLIGETKAAKLPTTAGVIQPTAAPLGSTGTYLQADRGFIAKFTPVTSAGGVTLAYATYLGGQTGNASDYLSGIAIDSASNAYVVGYTNSADFPVTSGAYGTVCGTGGTCSAAHVTKLNPYGTSILWSTYVGGGKSDGSDALTFTGPIQLDGKGNIYIMGQAGPGFPLVNPVEPPVNGGSMEVVVAELDAAGGNLLFSTRIGSGGLETSYPGGMAVDSAGDIYLAGNTIGPGLMTTPGAFQTTANASTCCYHGFVAKIAPGVVPVLQSGTLANGATYLAGGLVPGSWAQVKGTNLSTTTRTWATPDFAGLGNNLPTNLSGVQVNVNGQAAAVWFISPAQVNFQVPAGITGTATVQVIAGGQTSNPVTAAAATNSPGIFPVTANGTNYAAAVFLDGNFAGDPAIGPGFRNAVPGDIVQLFATGLGPSPAGTTVPTTLLNGVTVTIGPVTVLPGAAALVGPGEYQINFTVPQVFATMAPGVYPISVSLNGATSPGSINSSAPGPVVIPIQH